MEVQERPVELPATRTFTLRRRPIMRSLLAVLVVLNVGNAVSVLYGADTLASRYLLLPLEQNPSTWFAAFLLGLTGVLAFAVGRGQDAAGEWTLVGVLLVLMSLDEVAMFHERLGHLPAAPSVGGRPWVGAGLILAALVGVRLFRWARALDPSLRLALASGAATFMTGAVGFEVLSGKRRAAHGFDTTFWALASIEENLEMLGVLIVLSALLGVLCGPHGRCRIVVAEHRR
jgi:hypothetical protein